MKQLVTLEEMGGKAELARVSKTFYDKIYKHPWIKQYFKTINQEHIEAQQVNFMQRALGGKNEYVGKTPPTAHRHMFISEDLFALRQTLLKESFDEVESHPVLVEKWLKLDETFKRQIVRQSPADCTARLSTEGVINFANPRRL